MIEDLWNWIQETLSDLGLDDSTQACPKVVSISPGVTKIPLGDIVEFQVRTSPPGRYDMVTIEIARLSDVEITSQFDDTTGRIGIKFKTRSLNATDIFEIVAKGCSGSASARVTVSLFLRLWEYHPGRVPVCDLTRFANQCAVRMGVSFELSDLSLPTSLRRCTNQYSQYPEHSHGKIKGHVLAAQSLADWLTESGALGSRQAANGVDDIMGKSGVVFFLNGWGTTDHIDVWNGALLKGGDASYFDVDYDALWFWEVY